MTFGEILEEVAPTLEKADAAAHACFEPKCVRKGGTVAPEPRLFEKAENRFKEFDTDNGFAGRCVSYDFFKTNSSLGECYMRVAGDISHPIRWER